MNERKRPRDLVQSSTFESQRDLDLFEVERNILGRVVYKNKAQFRRNDILERVKVVVKHMDQLLSHPSTRVHSALLSCIRAASERFFQQLTMGLMIPMSMVCVGALGRVFEILHRMPLSPQPDSMRKVSGSCDTDYDDGVPVDR